MATTEGFHCNFRGCPLFPTVSLPFNYFFSNTAIKQGGDGALFIMLLPLLAKLLPTMYNIKTKSYIGIARNKNKVRRKKGQLLLSTVVYERGRR